MIRNCVLLCFIMIVSQVVSSIDVEVGETTDVTLSNYSVVVDLGSSGSRVFVYKREGDEVIGLKPKKISPGIASMAHNPIEAASYLRPIFEYAKELIPEEYHKATPFHLKATAGVRLLSHDKQRKLFDGLLKELRIDNGMKLGCPFLISDEHVGVISGDDEGFYAALSVNYLMGSVNSDLIPQNKTNSLFGALDMGGASTQIVFKPDETIENNNDVIQEVEISMSHQGEPQINLHPMPLQNAQVVNRTSTDPILRRNDFFSKSFLSFGADQIREKLWTHLIQNHTKFYKQENHNDVLDVISNPCGFVGYEIEWLGKKLIGTGDAKTCANQIRYVLFGNCAFTIDNDEFINDQEISSQQDDNQDDDRKSKDIDISIPKCSLNGYDSLPETDGVEFIAMSIYFFALDCMRTLSHLLQDGMNHKNHIDFASQWPKPSINSLYSASEVFCALSWEEVSAPHVSHKWTWADQMPHRCFETVFIATLLKEGYGVNPDERSITYALELEGMEVEWTLGYMLSKISDPFR